MADQKAAARQEKTDQKMTAKKPKNAPPSSREERVNLQPKESVDDDEQVQYSCINNPIYIK